MNMLKRLEYYRVKISEIQEKTQSKLDCMDLERNENLYCEREEKIEALDEIISSFDETIGLIADYNSQWNGLKSIV